MGGSLIVPGRGIDRDLLSKVPGTQGNKHQQTQQFTACRDRIQATTVNVMCPHGWAKGARWLGKQCFWECLGVSARASLEETGICIRRLRKEDPSPGWVGATRSTEGPEEQKDGGQIVSLPKLGPHPLLLSASGS